MRLGPERGRRGAVDRLVVVALGGLVTLAACGTPGFFVPPPDSRANGSPVPGASLDPGSVDTEPPPATAWEAATAGIARDGRVPLDVALTAFAVTIGPLPGVELPGEPPAGVDTGTGPVMWVLSHWSELSAEQQAEVRRLLDPSLDPPAAIAPHGRHLAAAGGPDGPGIVGPPPGATIEEYQAAAETARSRIEAKLPKRKLTRPIEVVFRNLRGGEGRTYATTIPTRADGSLAENGRMGTCQIQVTSLGQNVSGFEIDALMAHEVFHCFQFELGPLERVSAVPPWLAEGSAAWVGEDISGGSTIGAEFYVGWLRTPYKPLFARTYNAMGFFAHLKDSGVDPWPLLDRMNAAGEASSADAYEVAFKAAKGGAMVDAWGPSYFRDAALGADWSLGFPGVQDPTSTPRRTIALENGTSERFHVGSVSAASPTTIDVGTDVLVIKATSARGLVRFADGTVVTLADALGKPYCAKAGGCTCASGSAGAAHAFGNIAAGAVMVGITGHTEDVTYEIQGYGVDSACQKSPADFIEPPECYCAPGPLGNILPKP